VSVIYSKSIVDAIDSRTEQNRIYLASKNKQ